MASAGNNTAREGRLLLEGFLVAVVVEDSVFWSSRTSVIFFLCFWLASGSPSSFSSSLASSCSGCATGGFVGLTANSSTSIIQPSSKDSSEDHEEASMDMQAPSGDTVEENEDAPTDIPPEGRWQTRLNGIELLVACIFLASTVWLVMAIVYSSLILVVLRLQARGELDIFDEDFGRLFCCNGRCSLHLGFILRRFAIRLEQEQQRRAPGGNSERSGTEQARRIRIMTRDERRAAMERLLSGSPGDQCKNLSLDIEHVDMEVDSTGAPACSICLGEYGQCANVLSKTLHSCLYVASPLTIMIPF